MRGCVDGVTANSARWRRLKNKLVGLEATVSLKLHRLISLTSVPLSKIRFIEEYGHHLRAMRRPLPLLKYPPFPEQPQFRRHNVEEAGSYAALKRIRSARTSHP